MKLTEQQIKRINAAFERMSDAIVKFLNTCHNNGSPVKSVTVQTMKDGGHLRTKVRYHR